MDTPDENTTATTRPLFGNKMALAAVENTQTEAETAEVAQDEAMTAEAEEAPVETVEAADEAPLAETSKYDGTAASEAVTEPTVSEEAGITEATAETHQSIVDDAVAADYHAEAVEEETAVIEEAPEPSVDTVTEPVAGEVEADEADLAEAAAETEVALAAAVPEPVPVEVEQETETETSAEETVQVEPEAPAHEDAKSVEELQAERQKLDDEIKAKVDAQKASVIAQIKTVADTYGITADELVEAMGGLKSKRKGVPAKPKYRDPATGTIWSGRGKEPAWIKGQDRSKFAI